MDKTEQLRDSLNLLCARVKAYIIRYYSDETNRDKAIDLNEALEKLSEFCLANKISMPPEIRLEECGRRGNV